MPNEELVQRGYYRDGKLKGDKFGRYEIFEIGATNINALTKAGLAKGSVPVKFPFTLYSPPKRPNDAKPDAVIASKDGHYKIVAVKESKKTSEINTQEKRDKALEQTLFEAANLGAPVGVLTDGSEFIYVDVEESLRQSKIVNFSETRPFSPSLLDQLTTKSAGEKDPSDLAYKVWQAIWHATKEEPKACLMTFVEIFVLKFLSDNLSLSVLPGAYRFGELVASDPETFRKKHGKSQIEYYVETIRPKIKEIFPDKSTVKHKEVLDLFGFGTLISPASIINGFAFLKSGTTSLATFNRTFMEILGYFEEFGVLDHISPEFKVRLYETFLKKSARQSKLGQFFTPRNVVKAIIKMGQLSKLPDGAIVLDPACGVGGFLLESQIDENGLKDNYTFASGSVTGKIRFVGADIDVSTHILAKANTLIHFAEKLKDPSVTTAMLNDLMSQMFIVANTNETLGVLEHPVRSKVRLVMANPPYVTQGSKIFKDEIREIVGLRNGLVLDDYYTVGLGLESLFLRYISGALEPGGRAIVIVPQGLLTRTEVTTKRLILSECNLLASISLPRNTFFNTPQKTYILILEKRHTVADIRPSVLCGIASSIGETLDAQRIPTPQDNTLDEIADEFVRFDSTKSEMPSKRIKYIDASKFSETDRWDVNRFWEDDELVAIGERQEAITRASFIDEAETEAQEILNELIEVKKEINALSAVPTAKLTLSRPYHFRVRKGTRVTRDMARRNPGNIPVYSGRKSANDPLGMVDETWAKSQGIKIEEQPLITVNANGYVGATFVRTDRCIVHDDVMAIELLNPDLDLEYVAQELQSKISEGNFDYEAKLYSRVSHLEIDVPISEIRTYVHPTYGTWDIVVYDIEAQRKIATAVKRFETLRQRLGEIGQWANGTRIKGHK